MNKQKTSYKSLALKESIYKDFARYCKDKQTTMTDCIAGLIDLETQTARIPVEKAKRNIKIHAEHVEKLKAYCVANGLQMFDVMNNLIEKAINENLTVSVKKIFEVKSDNPQD